MPAWSNTDSQLAKPKFPRERTEHGVIKLSANAATTGATTLGFAPGATKGIVVGSVANGVNVGTTTGTVGYNLVGPTVASLTSNSVTLSAGIPGNIAAGQIISFSKPIVFRTGKAMANTYNANTILVTTSRKKNANANTRAANAAAHIGWNHYRVGTGGRAGRIQIETLVAMSNPKATIANSGGPYFPGT